MPNTYTQISDYDALVKEVQSYLNRNDKATLDSIPLFINTAEKYIKRVLRMPSLEKMVLFTTGDTAGIDGQEAGFIELPRDYLEMKNIWIGGRRSSGSTQTRVLNRTDMQTLLQMSISGSGDPTMFARSASRIYFRPIPHVDLPFTMTYYKDLPETGPNNPSSYLYTIAHDVWLFYALAEGFRFLYEEEKADYYKAQGDERIAQIHGQAEQAEWSGAPLRLL